MKEIREKSEQHPQLKTEIDGSLKPIIAILDDLFKQLGLKNKKFKTEDTNVYDLLEVGTLLKNWILNFSLLFQIEPKNLGEKERL